MGMYDWVESHDIRCPDCNEVLEYVQTKDGPKLLEVLVPGSLYKMPCCMRDSSYYNFSDIMIAYGRCPKCKFMWDINIPIVHVTGYGMLSPETEKYTYEKSKWAMQPDSENWDEWIKDHGES